MSERAPYQLVVADPPWIFRDKLRNNATKRGAQDNYARSMTVDEIAALPVRRVVADDAILCLWVTDAHLFEAQNVIRMWGFKYSQTAVWGKVQRGNPAKPKIGMGRIFRQAEELVLVCTRGRLQRHLALRNVPSLFLAPPTGHSEKPRQLQRYLEIMFPTFKRRVELFARRETVGWDCVGNELGSDVERWLFKAAAQIAKAK